MIQLYLKDLKLPSTWIFPTCFQLEAKTWIMKWIRLTPCLGLAVRSKQKMMSLEGNIFIFSWREILVKRSRVPGNRKWFKVLLFSVTWVPQEATILFQLSRPHHPSVITHQFFVPISLRGWWGRRWSCRNAHAQFNLYSPIA